MKTRARMQHRTDKGSKGESQDRQATWKTCARVEKRAHKDSVPPSRASAAVYKGPVFTGNRELRYLMGNILGDEELARIMADTVKWKYDRMKSTGSRKISLRSTPKKREIFQVGTQEEKKKKDALDDTAPETPKKLKFTSTKSTNDAEKTIPKTGKKAAILRMRREEINNNLTVTNKRLSKLTNRVNNAKCSSPEEDKRVDRRPTERDVLPSELCSNRHQDNNVGHSVLTSDADKLGTETVTKEDSQLGSLVWAKLSRQSWWPGLIIKGSYCALRPAQPGHRWIFWFGDHKVSQIRTDRIVPFCVSFREHVHGSSNSLFHKSIKEALKECVERVRLNMGCGGDLHEDTALEWAEAGFLVDGMSSDHLTKPNPDRPIPEFAMEFIRKIKTQNKTDDDSDSDAITQEEAPFRIEKLHTRGKLDDVRRGVIAIEEVCIACGEDRVVVTQHPFFHGGLCQFCKESLMETIFILGDDGTNVFCVICGNGGELFVCEETACNRAYCSGCIAELIGGLQSVETIKYTSPWACFMCDSKTDAASLLVTRTDWQCNLITLFQPATIHQIPQASDFDGNPIRVLSLFDGIASGKIALDDLRFDIGSYYSSEIDVDALLVTRVQHGSTIKPLGDITKLSVTEISALGPIDLLIGGSPCNDLSMVNPARKGLEGGTGLLFFEFCRILNLLQKLHPNCHLFWLFENVVFMSQEDKTTISRFLECEPAVWNAKYFSAQNRARYFWGNIPGMYCPPQLSPCPPPEVHLDSSLMGDRTAAVRRVRTVTTRSNSLMQGKKDDYFPVHMGSVGDTLWIPELERLFGFPDHYTDVGNIPPTRRQKLIGRAWSVPLIKHILTPLKSFYGCLPDGPRVAQETEVTHL